VSLIKYEFAMKNKSKSPENFTLQFYSTFCLP